MTKKIVIWFVGLFVLGLVSTFCLTVLVPPSTTDAAVAQVNGGDEAYMDLRTHETMKNLIISLSCGVAVLWTLFMAWVTFAKRSHHNEIVKGQ